MPRHDFARDRRGAVSVLFAGAAVPIIGIMGLSIDYTFLNEARTQMAIAADTAAISATRIASNEFVQPLPTWQSDAVTNGTQWYAVQLSAIRGASSNAPSVSVTRSGTVFTTSVGYSGNVPTHFARMFGFNNFAVSGTSVASVSIDAYVNITMLLDNSSSMLIGATTNDVNTMDTITACSPEVMGSAQSMSAWTGPTPSACTKTYAATTGVSYASSNLAPTAGKVPTGAPCGFACHWSTNKQVIPNTTTPDYTQYDYYALASNPTKYGSVAAAAPALRFSVVQAAAANVIDTMNSNEVIANQFGIAVYTFGNSLTRVYPAAPLEAGYDLTADSGGAQAAVTSIVQPVVANNGDTDFPDSLQTLATTDLTAGGDGSTAAKPKKDLIIVTDGIMDYTPSGGSRTLGPFTGAALTQCNYVKNMGIAIYVLYTPYTPLPYNPFYVSNIATYINTPPTPNATISALQACASSTSNYYEADIASQITTGLNALLKAAVSSPARINS